MKYFYLTKKDSKYSFDFLRTDDGTLNKFKFNILENLKVLQKDDYEMFQLIDINKVLKSNSDIQEYLNGDYDAYRNLNEMYKLSLDKFNTDLIDKYLTEITDFKPSCIIVPASSSNWLRNGLAEKFHSHFDIPIIYAQKIKNIQSTEGNCKELEFSIDSKSLIDAMYNNVLIIDDCKSSGCTMSKIKSLFIPKTLYHKIISRYKKTEFVEIFYYKNK